MMRFTVLAALFLAGCATHATLAPASYPRGIVRLEDVVAPPANSVTVCGADGCATLTRAELMAVVRDL